MSWITALFILACVVAVTLDDLLVRRRRDRSTEPSTAEREAAARRARLRVVPLDPDDWHFTGWVG